MGPCGLGNGPGGPGYGQRYGQGYGQAYGANNDAFGPRMQAILNLTIEQQEELIALRTEHFKTMNPLWAEMGEIQARERTLLAQEEIDVEAVNQVIEQRTDLSKVIQKKQLQNRMVCRSVLTQEQQVQFDQARMNTRRYSTYTGYGRRGNRPGRGYRW